MRKEFVFILPFLLAFVQCKTSPENGIIMTVNEPVSSEKMGKWLTHEHILVDFIGADSICKDRWDKSAVIEKAFPQLEQVKIIYV